MAEASLQVEIVSAEPHRAIVKTLRVPTGSCAADALRLAAMHEEFAGVDMVGAAFGVFGKPIGPDHVLKEGDRIEIYRPLAADPKVARRARAQQARKPR